MVLEDLLYLILLEAKVTVCDCVFEESQGEELKVCAIVVTYS